MFMTLSHVSLMTTLFIWIRTHFTSLVNIIPLPNLKLISTPDSSTVPIIDRTWGCLNPLTPQNSWGTKYSLNFKSRAVAYYGNYSYSYSWRSKKPIPTSENPYLERILCEVRKQFPNFEFNSAMVTKYCNGEQFISFHSDNEKDISSNSDICTISFGQEPSSFGPKTQHQI